MYACLRCPLRRQAVGRRPAYVIPAHSDLSTLWVIINSFNVFLGKNNIPSDYSATYMPMLYSSAICIQNKHE